MKYGLVMKPVEKAEWVAALRSGKYEQGQGSMCTLNYQYCCLGVHSEIKNLPKVRDNAYFNFKYPGGTFYTSIPDQDWFATFFDFCPTSKIKEKREAIGKLIDQCTMMNDGVTEPRGRRRLPKSFGQIANWIEKNL